MHEYVKSVLFIFIVLSVLLPPSLFADEFETLPSYHWAYNYINELQNRGFCLDLLAANKPYTRSEIAKSLNKLGNRKDIDDSISIALLQRLFDEFNKKNKNHGRQQSNTEYIISRLNTRSNLEHDQSDAINYRGIHRCGVGLGIGNNFFAFSGIKLDQYDYNDPSYTGYRWPGFAGYA